MDQFSTSQLRNVVLLSHSGAGKTSLAEAMLHTAKGTNRLGTVEDGNTVSDHEPEEQRRQTSLQTSVLPCVWKGQKINLLDTPGYAEFLGEMLSGLRAADAAVLVVSAPAGVEVGTDQMWRRLRESELPLLIFVNKMDRENASFAGVLAQIRERLGRQCVALDLPVGAEAQFKDVVSLRQGDLPAEIQDVAASAREALIEAVAETDDELTNKYLETAELTAEELDKGLKQGVRAGQIVPVLTGSATASKGVEQLMDAIVSYLPSPEEMPPAVASRNGQEVELQADSQGPLAASVFKTTADPFVGKLSYLRLYSGMLKANSEVWNVAKAESERIGQLFVPSGKSQVNVAELAAGDIGGVAKLGATTTGDTLAQKSDPVRLAGVPFPNPIYTVAVRPKSKADLEKMSSALTRLAEEDPSLRVGRDAATGEITLSGLGNSHVEVLAEKAKRKFGVELELSAPQVAYHESITQTTRVEYRHKKQTGGHGQYGHVLLRLEPLERGQGHSFASEVIGGNVPREYIPAVEKGVMKAMEGGVLGGHPIVDMRVVLYDGSSHSVDSSGMSFEIAGNMAVKKGMVEASPVLLEPVMRMEVTVPNDYTGDIIGDLNTRRAKIGGMRPEGDTTVVEAEVPQAEVLQYATVVRALTQGRGSFTTEFDHYDEVPAHLTQRILEASKKETAKV